MCRRLVGGKSSDNLLKQVIESYDFCAVGLCTLGAGGYIDVSSDNKSMRVFCQATFFTYAIRTTQTRVIHDTLLLVVVHTASI